MNNQLTFLSLGGIGSVTRNMYLYIVGDEILIVDCGLGFADDTMIGVDLLLPDISPLLTLLNSGKKIVGMVITHGHEDHMGALPFVLPQLPQFPIFATPFTAALANEKLRQLNLPATIKEVTFDDPAVQIGSFSADFIRVTHSVPDTAHIFIKTPVGNFYHGSDFKFDLTPVDGKKSDLQKIVKLSQEGVRCLFSDCLGSEKRGYTPSEQTLTPSFEHALRSCEGRCLVTTYSSNINRLNQIIDIAISLDKYVCFVGRSLIKAKDIARQKGLLHLPKEREVAIDQLKKYAPEDLVLFVAGSQAQENSALTRIIDGEHREVKLSEKDLIIFSADPIPGNEVSINALIDSIARMGIKTYYSDLSVDFHVSGHGSSQELQLLMSLVKAQQVLPISGTYKHMVAYKELAKEFGFLEQNILMADAGQEVIFRNDQTAFGAITPLKHVYVDQISGEEVEHFVLRDRQKLSQEGVVAVIVEMDTATGKLAGTPEVIARGFTLSDTKEVTKVVIQTVNRLLINMNRVADGVYMRKYIRESVEKKLYMQMKRSPLILPIVIEL